MVSVHFIIIKFTCINKGTAKFKNITKMTGVSPQILVVSYCDVTWNSLKTTAVDKSYASRNCLHKIYGLCGGWDYSAAITSVMLCEFRWDEWKLQYYLTLD